MKDLFAIPEEFLLHQSDNAQKKLKDRLFGEDFPVSSVECLASIKPNVANVSQTRTDKIRYDEIILFWLTIYNSEELYKICKQIFKKIKYPCLIFVEFEGRVLVSSCQYTAGKKDYDENILHSIKFTHWIFPDELTENAKNFIYRLNNIIISSGDIFEIYTEMSNLISGFSGVGLTKAHVLLLIKDMTGRKTYDKIFKKLVQRKRYHLANSGKYAICEPRANSYNFSFDSEDVWHAFIQDELIRKTVVGRKYESMEDLLISIDKKYNM